LFIKKLYNKTIFISETSFRSINKDWCGMDLASRGKPMMNTAGSFARCKIFCLTYEYNTNYCNNYRKFILL